MLEDRVKVIKMKDGGSKVKDIMQEIDVPATQYNIRNPAHGRRYHPDSKASLQKEDVAPHHQ